MESPIKEKFNIFRSLVMLVDKHLSSVLITTLAVGFWYQTYMRYEDKDRYTKDIVSEVRRQVPGEVSRQTIEVKRSAKKMDTAVSLLDTAVQVLSNKNQTK